MTATTVEIAFDSGYGTPADDRTWTDVSDYVELQYGMTIQVGRQDERSEADANQLTLTLDNSDGRFTPGKSSSPYYPNVKLYRPIRVSATPVDGDESVRFLGYVNAWPQEWEGSDGSSKVTISASSRLARLGLTTRLKSIIETEILADSPDAYYTLGEPESATWANDSSGNNVTPLTFLGNATPPVVFGSATGPSTDGLTAAQFQGGQYLGASTGFTAAGYGFGGFFRFDSAPGTIQTIAQVGGVTVNVETDGKVACRRAEASLTTLIGRTSSSVAGSTLHFWVNKAPGGATFYIDGAQVGLASWDPLPIPAFAAIVGGGTQDPFVGVVAHFEIGGVLTLDRIATRATAGRDGFAGETTDERLARYAALAAIPSAEVSAETGSTTMAHIDTTDKQAIELMRLVESTEGGVLFDAPDGTLTMQSRAHRYEATSLYTLTMKNGQEVEDGYSPRLDATALLNEMTASNGGGTIAVRRFDQDSIDDYGHIADSVTTYSEDDDAPTHLAGWRLHQYKEPKERAPQLAVQALAQVGKAPSCADIMSTTIGDKITVDGRPSQAATDSVDYFVEGWTEEYGHESLLLTFNVSPSAPYDEVLIIGDADRGVIGTNPVAY